MATFPVTLRAALSGETLAVVEVSSDDTPQALRAAVCPTDGAMMGCDFLLGSKVLASHQRLGEAGVESGGVVDVVRCQGPWLATASADGAARLWDLSSGECCQTLHGHGGGLRKVVMLPDHQHVLTGSDDGTARLWNLATGDCQQTLGDHAASVTDVSASLDGQLLLTIAHGELRVWRTIYGDCIWNLDDEYVLHACFAPNSAEVLVASSTQLRTCCLREMQERAQLKGHVAAVLAATYSRDGSVILSASIDRTARVWDSNSGQCLHILSGHLDSVRTVAISANGELMATASGITARVWSSLTGTCDMAINKHSGTIYALQFSADARTLLVAFGCGREIFAGPEHSGVKVWCTRTMTCLTTLLPGNFVIAASFSPDASKVVTACSDRAELWDASSGKRLRSIPCAGSTIRSVTLS